MDTTAVINNLFDNIGRINYQLLLKKKIKLTIKNSKFYKSIR